MTRIATSTLAIALLAGMAAAAKPDFTPQLDTAGKVYRLGEKSGTKAIAIVFLGPDCPISQRYVPTLNGIAKALPAGVELYGVVSQSTISFAAAEKYATEYKLAFPVLFDGSGHFAAQLKPTHVPEAFVLNADFDVQYRGRIDDWYEKPGKARAMPTTNDFRDAIAAVVAGKPVATAATEPVGCLFEEEWPKANSAPAKPNYNRHVSAILNSRCVVCHREGEVAPFPLTTYAEAKAKGKQLVASTQSGQMPPWKATKGFGHFLDENHLSAWELATLKQWQADGLPEGDAADKPAAVAIADGWTLGKPDLIVKMPEAFAVPASGPDVLRNFVIPLKTKEDKAVRAIHFRPGNKKIVHHALCYVDSSGIARKLDAEDDGPGYASAKGGIGFLPTGSLGGWAPGVLPRFVPEGTGRYLARGADLVLQMHYHPSGKEESDVSEVGIYYCKETPKKYLAGFGVENWTIAMPAGEARYELNAEYKLTVPVTLIGTAPHMHLLGKSLKSWAETPDGKTIPLIEVKHWDFNWQDFYLYRKPIDLPKGTIVKMESVHDNSSSNPANPNNPPKPIKWGEGTADEMSLVLFEVTTPTMLDMYGLIADNIRQNKILERFTEPPKPKKK